jgi:hypothetical protein
MTLAATWTVSVTAVSPMGSFMELPPRALGVRARKIVGQNVWTFRTMLGGRVQQVKLKPQKKGELKV